MKNSRLVYKINPLFLFFILLPVRYFVFGNEPAFSGRTNDAPVLISVPKSSDFGFVDNVISGSYEFQQQKLGRFVPITGNISQLKHFFEGLANSRKKKVRIAHFGDSIILGDIITEYLREDMQLKFGGIGQGLLPIIPDDARMRRTTYQTFSDDWINTSIALGNREGLPLGINGTVAVPKAGSWVKYQSTEATKTTVSFNMIRIFYAGADESSKLQYKIDNDAWQNLSLKSGSDLKEGVINSENNAKTVEIKFISGKAPYFYGVSLESKSPGVYIDNFPNRGNSGISLLDLQEKLLSQFNSLLDYDLIILNFGANVTFPTNAGFIFYEKKMIELIGYFKKTFSNAGILLITVGDKTIKRGSQFLTNPEVPILLETQTRIADKSNIALWNMWEAMGGRNSMNTWVNAAPPQALKDYSHFTNAGGERIGNLLFDAIIEASHK
jgi:lysophospholipase L1-like esterase